MVLDGTWCQKCKNSPEKWLNELDAFAKQKGGLCLSKEYVKSSVKLQWQCQNEHIWEAKPNNILNGTWCPTCAKSKVTANRRRTIHDLRRVAIERGGQCLAESLITPADKVRWRCKEGHEWLATPQSVIGAKNWCPLCGKMRWQEHLMGQHPAKLLALQEVAKTRGGLCVSKDYVRQVSPLEWQCSLGHRWFARPANILQGGWCPECSSGLGERICRIFFEKIFKTQFPKTRPNWLKTPRGTLLELDGYSQKLKLAFEHQGSHHYKVDKRYSKDALSLKFRQNEDALKRRLCKKYGIALIEVPEIPALTPLDSIQNFILKKTKICGIRVPLQNRKQLIDFSDAYKPLPILSLITEEAKNRSGELLSSTFRGWSIPLEWQCAKGHRWNASPGSVYHQKSWCPECAGVLKKTILDMQKIATERGGACLSKIYRNSHSLLRWKCNKGHEWAAASTNILSKNSWCPYCAGQKGTHVGIIAMREHANKFGGQCLSTEYKNSKTKLLWQCTNGHKWEAMPLNVIHKRSWCPTCANQKKGPQRIKKKSTV